MSLSVLRVGVSTSRGLKQKIYAKLNHHEIKQFSVNFRESSALALYSSGMFPSPPKWLFFMSKAKLPNRPGFALLRGGGGLARHHCYT